MNLEVTIDLRERRCEQCAHWFATERCQDWSCGTCIAKRNERLLEQIDTLERSNRALRVALRQRKPGKGRK